MDAIEDYPRTLPEFEERFATEDACRRYLEAVRWPGGFVCPSCGAAAGWRSARGLWECVECGRQASVTAGTVLHGARLPLTGWFRAMWHITSQKYGANALGLQRILGLGSYQTAWEWLHKLRRAMVRPGRERLRGTVEVDETYVGGPRPGKRGRGAAGKVAVAIAVEDKGGGKMGRVRLAVLPDVASESLRAFVLQSVEPGSVVRTDGMKSYDALPADGYVHVTAGSRDLGLAHRVASLFKRWLLGTYQGAVRPGCLPYYLDEYTFRFNRRTSAARGKLFFRLVEQIVATAPKPRSSLVGLCRLQAADCLDPEEGRCHR